ncbi:box c/d snoRNA protein [Anaeramoeba ignava]|uniref:Box c/d snoRNA protein n=1 Tax=Anaeramoeba ignava TaxID=1746090 RepID=A0A9Q0LPJ2_ANAIG|nr:box c/d snoRNA protein [Anaeramoeba ignava]
MSENKFICEICQEKSKYTCPSCGMHTCSLKCYQEHKAKFNCSGKRSKTDYISLKNFDENNFFSDINFLEECEFVMKRQKTLKSKPNNQIRKLPFFLQKLIKKAQNQQIQPKKSIQYNLRFKTIIEYPIIKVCSLEEFSKLKISVENQANFDNINYIRFEQENEIINKDEQEK